MRHHAGRSYQAIPLAGGIDIPQQRTAANVDRPRLRVDEDRIHPRQIAYDPVVAGAKASEAVTTAAHRQRHIAVSGDAHDLLNIAHRRCPHDHAGPAFDDRVVDATKAIILGVRRITERAVKVRARKVTHH